MRSKPARQVGGNGGKSVSAVVVDTRTKIKSERKSVHRTKRFVGVAKSFRNRKVGISHSKEEMERAYVHN